MANHIKEGKPEARKSVLLNLTYETWLMVRAAADKQNRSISSYIRNVVMNDVKQVNNG